VLGVASGVQDLQADQVAGSVHRIGDHAMLAEFSRVIERARIGFEQPGRIGRVTAGDDERHAAPGAFGVKGGGARAAVGHGPEAGVHRAHDNAIFQCDRAGLQRLKQALTANSAWGFYTRSPIAYGRLFVRAQ